MGLYSAHERVSAHVAHRHARCGAFGTNAGRTTRHGQQLGAHAAGIPSSLAPALGGCRYFERAAMATATSTATFCRLCRLTATRSGPHALGHHSGGNEEAPAPSAAAGAARAQGSDAAATSAWLCARGAGPRATWHHGAQHLAVCSSRARALSAATSSIASQARISTCKPAVPGAVAAAEWIWISAGAVAAAEWIHWKWISAGWL